MELLAVVWMVISSAGMANTVPAWSAVDYHDLTTTDTPALCDKNDLEYYIEKYEDMESCYRDFYEKQRTGTAPADSTREDLRDTCLKVDELYKCRTMFGRNVSCVTGLTDQEVDEYNRERLQSHHFAPQQCKDFYKNVEVDPKFRDCPLRTGVPMWREFETCLNRFMLYASERTGSTFCALVRAQLKRCSRMRQDLSYYCGFRNNSGMRTVFARNFIHALKQLDLDPVNQNWRHCIAQQDVSECEEDDLCTDWTLWTHRNIIHKHTEMQRQLLKQERMYNERVSDRNQILVWLGLFGLLIPAYAIYAVCGARSSWGARRQRTEEMETHIPVIYVPTYRDGKDPDKPEGESLAKKVLRKQREQKAKKVEGHKNIAIVAAAAAEQASAPDAPDGAAAAGEGDLEGTTGDPEVDSILKASKALTAASDSADEDDEKEVAELERELSRRLEAVESGQPHKHKKHRHHHHHHHHHRHQLQQQEQQQQEQMQQRQMEHPSIRRLQSSQSGLRSPGSEKSVSFQEVGI